MQKSSATNLAALGAYLSKREENLLHCFLQYDEFCLLLETVLLYTRWAPLAQLQLSDML